MKFILIIQYFVLKNPAFFQWGVEKSIYTPKAGNMLKICLRRP